MSSRSHPAVFPLDIEVPQLTEGVAAENGGLPDDRVRMKDIQGMPGTTSGLVLRLIQFGFAAVSVAIMAATSDFPSVTPFRYLVASLSLQCLWSLSLAIVDIYALLVKRCLRNPRVVGLFTIGDGTTSTLTFSAACASAGITVLIGNDFNNCWENHCTRFETSTAMAFIMRHHPSTHISFPDYERIHPNNRRVMFDRENPDKDQRHQQMRTNVCNPFGERGIKSRTFRPAQGCRRSSGNTRGRGSSEPVPCTA